MALGKDLDRLLKAKPSELLAAAGFKAKRKPRVWTRTVDGTFEVLIIGVDARTARDGYLVIDVGLGLRYPFDDPNSRKQIAGEAVGWSAEGLAIEGRDQPQWHFRSDDNTGHQKRVVDGIADYLAQVMIPAADRFLDPERLLLHKLTPSDPWGVVDLALKLDRRDVAQNITVAGGQRLALLPKIGTSARIPIEYAERTGAQLHAEDDRALRVAIAAELDRLTARHGQLPDSLQDLRRFLED